MIAEVIRSGFPEGRHHGRVYLAGPDGGCLLRLGDTDRAFLPRSANKPLQLVGMLQAGLDQLLHPPADEELLAVAAASHSGQPVHVRLVAELLGRAGLSTEQLDNTPGLPIDAAAARDMLRSGAAADSLHQNCSGKHAAMLATCAVAGWPTAGYRRPEHPLQLAIRSTIERLCAERVAAVAVDGCGAPLFAVSPRGLAAAYRRLVTAPVDSAARRVADAMRRHPHLVGGDGREVTRLMQGVPGLLAKDGADGVYAAATATGHTAVVKVDDGADRARTPVLVAALRALGVQAAVLDELAVTPVLGHGEPVGGVFPASPLAAVSSGT